MSLFSIIRDASNDSFEEHFTESFYDINISSEFIFPTCPLINQKEDGSKDINEKNKEKQNKNYKNYSLFNDLSSISHFEINKII